MKILIRKLFGFLLVTIPFDLCALLIQSAVGFRISYLEAYLVLLYLIVWVGILAGTALGIGAFLSLGIKLLGER